MRTFNVIGEFDADGFIELCCPKCLTDALVPTNGRPDAMVIASFGLNLITDPPLTKLRDDYMPSTIQCRKCKTVFTSEKSDVRQIV